MLSSLLLSSSALAQDPGYSDIVNGSEEDEFPSAVAIGAEVFGQRMSTCSASLITPRILLTAAHCSEELLAQYGLPSSIFIEAGRAFFGTNVNSSETLAIRFTDVIPHPNYGTGMMGTPQYDIEVIVLAEDAPVEPTWFATELNEEMLVGERVTSVGYGITSASTQSGSGIKRSAKLVIDELMDQFLVSQTSTNRDGANVCSGDSGGPQYHREEDGRWIQWAVHSWADQTCSFMSGSTRTDVDVEWLMQEIEAVHGSRDFCEISGYYGDGTCDEFCDQVDADCLDDPTGGGGAGGEGAGGCACNGSGTTPLAALLPLALLTLRRRRS
jgi:secreted trypsin-like serine protease